MKLLRQLIEIWTQEYPEENLEKYVHLFTNSQKVGNIKHLSLFKSAKDDNIYYGLFDEKVLVGILHLMKTPNKPKLYGVIFSQVNIKYQQQGLGTLLYSYPVQHEELIIFSDERISKSALSTWKKLQQLFNGKIYNSQTGEIRDYDEKNCYG